MSDLTSSGFFNNNSRVQINEAKYISALRKAAKEERIKNSPLLNENLWEEFADYSKRDLISNCYALSNFLLEEGVSHIGIDVEKDEIYEPRFVVMLSNEYRNDDLYIKSLPQNWAGGRLTICYRTK